LHPLLAGLVKDAVMTFDGRGKSNSKIKLLDASGNLLSEEQMMEFLSESDIPLRPLKFFKDADRASGLFIYDIAIDLRRLFCVSLDIADPELKRGLADTLRQEGWVDSINSFGPCLVCPTKQRNAIIPALASALINWEITSNQSRTFHPREVLAVAISQNANHIVNAIRADLDDSGESSRPRALPRIDTEAGATLFVPPVAAGHILGAQGSSTAIEDAEAHLRNLLSAYPYEG